METSKKLINGLKNMVNSLSKESVPHLSDFLQDFMPDISEKKIIQAIERRPVSLEWLKRIFAQLNPSCQKKFFSIIGIKCYCTNKSTIKKFVEKEGFQPPAFLIISPTGRCNLSCWGCWAEKYNHLPDMGIALFKGIIKEARDKMGIHFINIAGGEPFIREDIFQCFEEYPDVYFQIFTNGLLVTSSMIKKISQLGNIALMISLEGGEKSTDERRGKGSYKKIMRLMKSLYQNGIPYGFSVTVTQKNLYEVVSEDFIEEMLEKKCLAGWYFPYVPVRPNYHSEFILNLSEIKYLQEKVSYFKTNKPILLSYTCKHTETSGSCMKRNKKYIHINPHGGIETCIFAPPNKDTILDNTSLTLALRKFWGCSDKTCPT